MPRRRQEEEELEEDDSSSSDQEGTNDTHQKNTNNDDDDDDNDGSSSEEREGQQRNRDGHRKTTVGLLNDSGLTEEDRRQLRKQQRELYKDLEDDKESMNVEKARHKNNQLYKKVRYTREAVLDGEMLVSIAQRASQKVDRLMQVPRYDADRLVHKLVSQVRAETSTGGGTESTFDWELLGEAAGACFNALPSDISFLNGPLQKDAPPIQRKLQQQRQKAASSQQPEDVVEERPEDIQGHTEKDDNKLSAIEKSMKDMARELKNQVDQQYRDNKRLLEEIYGTDKSKIPIEVQKKFKRYGIEIDAMEFLLNPQSFTQTVENIFHYSFLIKKGTAAIALRDNTNTTKGLFQLGEQQGNGNGNNNNNDATTTISKPGLKIKYVSDEKGKGPARQSIMSLTMEDWRSLCDAYNVYETGGGLPHRKIHKEAHSNSLSQQATG